MGDKQICSAAVNKFFDGVIRQKTRNPKEYGSFSACYAYPKTKNTYSRFGDASPVWAYPSKIFCGGEQQKSFTPSI